MDVTVQVNPASYAAGQAVAKFIGDIKAAVKAGGVLAEITAIAGAGVADLVPVLSQLQTIPSEVKASPQAEVTTGLLVGEMVYNSIVG